MQAALEVNAGNPGWTEQKFKTICPLSTSEHGLKWVLTQVWLLLMGPHQPLSSGNYLWSPCQPLPEPWERQGVARNLLAPGPPLFFHLAEAL